MKIGKTIIDGFGAGEPGRMHGDGFGEGDKRLESGIGKANEAGDGYGFGDHEVTKGDFNPHLDILYRPDGDPSDW